MKLRWGIVGAGSIAEAFALGATTCRTGELRSVGSRDIAKAQSFAAKFAIPAAFGSYSELLADGETDAVYICTPHPMHVEWVLAALEAGKHVLCEKPISMNLPEAEKMFSVAEKRRLLLMEAFMYRCHPQTKKLVELLSEDAVGEIISIQATFSFQAGFNPESRLFKKELGGGSILDVGCYPVSFSRLVAGVAEGAGFADPAEVRGAGFVGASGVDEWAAAVLKFNSGMIAQVSSGVSVNQDNSARIYGSGGRLLLPNPWVAGRKNPEDGRIIMQRNGKAPEEILVPANRTSFSYEIDVFDDAVASGKPTPEHPAMSAKDSLGNMRVLDSWRRECGCTSDDEG